MVLARDLLLGGRVHGRMVRTFSGLELFPSLAAHTAHTAADCRTLYRDICSKLHYLLKISKTVPKTIIKIFGDSASGGGHSYNSERSSVVQMITFLVLAADSSHWSGQLLADTALLLTTSQGPRQSRLQLCSHIHIFSMCCYSMCQTAWSLRVSPPGSRAWPPLSDRFVLYCTVLYCTVLCCTGHYPAGPGLGRVLPPPRPRARRRLARRHAAHRARHFHRQLRPPVPQGDDNALYCTMLC